MSFVKGIFFNLLYNLIKIFVGCFCRNFSYCLESYLIMRVIEILIGVN